MSDNVIPLTPDGRGEPDDLDFGPEDDAAIAADPVAMRLEQLAAHLPVPSDALARIEQAVLAQYLETMRPVTIKPRRSWRNPAMLRRAFAVGLAAVFVIASVSVAAAHAGP